MGNQNYLIDTNVVIEYFSEKLPEEALLMLDGIIDKQFYLSVINKIELLGFPGLTIDEENKFHEFIKASKMVALDEDIVNATIIIRKENKIKIPDAIIAATALVNELTILTRNTNDFEKIEGIKILNPHQMKI